MMTLPAMAMIAKIPCDPWATRRCVRGVILSAGVVDDTTGWLILSGIAGIAGQSGFPVLGLLRTLGLTAAFLLFPVFVAGPGARRLFPFPDPPSPTPNTDPARWGGLPLL